jgi:hypothetical protein
MLAPTLAACAIIASSASAQVTQSTSPNSSDTCCWQTVDLGGVVFAPYTSSILSLTATGVGYDQGIDNYDPIGNAAWLHLTVNGNAIWSASAIHGLRNDFSVQSFDASSDPTSWMNLNDAMAGIDWSSNPDVEMHLESDGFGYPEWELHIRDASFSVESESTAPEPATLVLMGSGLAGIALLRRRTRAA